MPKPPTPGTIEWAAQRATVERLMREADRAAKIVQSRLNEVYRINPSLVCDEGLQAAAEVVEECRSVQMECIPGYFSQTRY